MKAALQQTNWSVCALFRGHWTGVGNGRDAHPHENGVHLHDHVHDPALHRDMFDIHWNVAIMLLVLFIACTVRAKSQDKISGMLEYIDRFDIHWNVAIMLSCYWVYLQACKEQSRKITEQKYME